MTSSWFFLPTLNYDARSTTHQIMFSKLEHLHSQDYATFSRTEGISLIVVFRTLLHWSSSRTKEIQFTHSKTTSKYISILSFYWWLWRPKSLFSSGLLSKIQNVYDTHNITQSGNMWTVRRYKVKMIIFVGIPVTSTSVVSRENLLLP